MRLKSWNSELQKTSLCWSWQMMILSGLKPIAPTMRTAVVYPKRLMVFGGRLHSDPNPSMILNRTMRYTIKRWWLSWIPYQTGANTSLPPRNLLTSGLNPDHQNLQYFKKPQKLNHRQAQWVTELSEYVINLSHKPGKTMGKANALSRMTGLETGVNNNEDIVMLKPEYFILNLVIENPEDDILNLIKKWKLNMDTYVQTRLNTKDKDWEETNDRLVLFQNHIYIPKDKTVQGRIIGLHHDTQVTEHPGQYKTIELLTQTYWWPGVTWDVKAYVTGCKKCQATKVHCQKPVGPLHPHDIPNSPWEVVGTDLISALPESGGYNAISVTTNHFTKWLWLNPTQMTCTSEGMAWIYWDKIFPIHGLPANPYMIAVCSITPTSWKSYTDS